ncbi:hypothetical protein [Rhizobium sp. BK376]|uniref:hypothetical protein n=1 Tax=Rhizobium sp. BK376 TaxID=2512149 RepID=UPI00104D2BB0|nr:hypothetical protein [Rhizobium sp. BK376]TCR65951.1 hypothetical protein EV561_1551 [Rhizobium sp. BK376]
MRIVPVLLLAYATLGPVAAMASEADFLKSIEGQWSGGGTVLAKLGGSNVDVSCKMKSSANAANFAMDGSCRALVVVTRSFTARVKATGTSYSGTYVGVSGKPSTLQGSRSSNTLNLDVTWAAVEYGDKKAVMIIQRVGDDGLRIQTVDKDPQSGKSIVTTDLKLKRI